MDISGLLDELRRAGALLAPLPRAFGGRGWGTEPGEAKAILAELRRIGHTSLPLGRLYEGHVNAIRLIARYGTGAQILRAADDARAGHLFAIWAAEAPDAPVRLRDGELAGRKTTGSGVGLVARAVVTATLPDGGEQLVYVADPPATPDGPFLDLHGLHGTATAPLRLDGVAAPAEALIGVPGDYMRQPEISLSAWRTLAVILGGLDALAEALRDDLVVRNRTGSPHQRARFGKMLVARETAALWVARCCGPAEAENPGEAAANLVKLARIATEAAAFDAIRLAQRSAGLAGLVRPHAIERLSRDLATYLRQPALDEVLDEAAGFFLAHDLPSQTP